MQAHALVPLLRIKFFLKNIKILIFGGISKFLKLILLEQILAKFGSYWAILD